MTWRSSPFPDQRTAGTTSGYSLLELLVVMTILGLIMGLVPVAYRRMIPAVEARQSASNMASHLRDARTRALQEGRDVVVLIDVANRKAWSNREVQSVEWPESIQVIAQVAGSEQRDAEVGGIRFFNDGGSTGGRLRFIASGREYDVDVDWLLGAVDMSRPDAT